MATNQELGRRREVIALIVNKLSEEGAWDSMRAKDVPDEIINYVLTQIEMGYDPREVRKSLGIKSQTSKEWQKIASAIKMGYRVNTSAYFHRLLGRNEKISEKLYRILNEVLDDDVAELKKKTTKKGETFLSLFVGEVTPMIDAMNRLQLSTVKLGRDLGVFTNPDAQQGGGGGTTIVVKSNILIPSPEKMIRDKIKEENTIEAEVVKSKDPIS